MERGFLQGRCRGREKEGALWRGMARAGALDCRWPSLFMPAAGGRRQIEFNALTGVDLCNALFGLVRATSLVVLLSVLPSVCMRPPAGRKIAARGGQSR